MREATCKSCGAKIVWIQTTSGRMMPCEPDPIPYWGKLGAKDKIVTQNGEVLSCEYEGETGNSTGIGYIPHWGNCSFKQKGVR